MQPELGKNLRAARQKLQKTQTVMASLMRVTFATYSRWENGHVIPTAKHRERINKLIEIAEKQTANNN